MTVFAPSSYVTSRPLSAAEYRRKHPFDALAQIAAAVTVQSSRRSGQALETQVPAAEFNRPSHEEYTEDFEDDLEAVDEEDVLAAVDEEDVLATEDQADRTLEENLKKASANTGLSSDTLLELFHHFCSSKKKEQDNGEAVQPSFEEMLSAFNLENGEGGGAKAATKRPQTAPLGARLGREGGAPSQPTSTSPSRPVSARQHSSVASSISPQSRRGSAKGGSGSSSGKHSWVGQSPPSSLPRRSSPPPNIECYRPHSAQRQAPTPPPAKPTPSASPRMDRNSKRLPRAGTSPLTGRPLSAHSSRKAVTRSLELPGTTARRPSSAKAAVPKWQSGKYSSLGMTISNNRSSGNGVLAPDSPSRSPPTTPKRDAPSNKLKAASAESTPNRPTSARYIRSSTADLVHRSPLRRPASAHPTTTKQSTPKRRPSTAHSTSRYSSPASQGGTHASQGATHASQGATRASITQASLSESYRSYVQRPQSAHLTPSKKWTDLGEEHTRGFHDVPIVKKAMEFNGPKVQKPSVPKFERSKVDEASDYLAMSGKIRTPSSKSGEADKPRPAPNPEKVSQTIKALAIAQSIGIGKKQLKGIERSTGLSVTDLTDLLWRFQKGSQARKKTAFVKEENEPGVKEIGHHEFHEIMATYGITDQRAIEHLFSVFDKDRDNTMSFYEFSEVVGKLRNGSDMEKARILFNLYNIRKNNDMTAKELTFMLHASPSPPNQEELSHMMTAIWNLLDEDRSGRIDREEFEEGLVKRPLVMEFLNRWFVEPQLLREDNDKTNITAKNEFLDRKSWNLNTFDIGKRLGLDLGNEEVYEWNESLYTNYESSPSTPNTKRGSVAHARRPGSQIATSNSPKTVRAAVKKIRERLKVSKFATDTLGAINERSGLV